MPSVFIVMMALAAALQRVPPTAAAPPASGVLWRGQPGGLQTAISEGNPQAAGPFTMLLKLPDAVWIPPHFHNVDKKLIVLKGTLMMGHGDAIDSAHLMTLAPGVIATMPANEHHYEGGDGETIVALIATGPFTTSMVQPTGTAPASRAPSPGTPAVCRSTGDASTVNEIRAVVTGLIDADNARAIDRVMASYATNAVLWPPDGSTVVGGDAIRPRYAQLFADADPRLTTTLTSTCVDGALAVVTGHNGGRFDSRTGAPPRTVSDDYVMLLGRGADGRWRVTHLAWTPARH